MSQNQRLMIAVALSIVFFVAYTAIFPSVQPEVTQENKQSQSVQFSKDIDKPTIAKAQTVEDIAGHSIAQDEKVNATSSNTIATINSKNFILKIDTLGRISSMELLEKRFQNKDGGNAQLISQTGTKPLYIRFLQEDINQEAIKVPYKSSVANLSLENGAKKITLTQKLSDLTITKELMFYADGHYDIKVNLTKDKRYFMYLGQRPKVNQKEQAMSAVGALIYTDDEIATIIEDGDVDTKKTFTGVEMVSAFDQYSATIMYDLGKNTTVVVDRDRDDNPVVYFDGMQDMTFNGYIGQKNFNTLNNIKPVLTNAVEYGWFTFAAKPLFTLLSWLHSILGNWGWSIVALTLVVRTVLYPLTYKGMVSMQKIKEISPQIKEIQAKYKGDPQRVNAATMAMYKKHKANPLGGCLPMLLQIPIFFAIYRVLLNAVELQGAPWILWVQDLSRMDSYYILPILMGASMFFQQRLTPNNFTDPMQEKVFKYLPVIFTFFFVTFPSGLVLYWFVNNLFSIAQQFVVNAQFKNAKDAEIAIAKHKKVEEKDD